MAERTFPKPSALTNPAYADMSAQMADARRQWDRMHVAESVQAPAQIAMPFIMPVPVGCQPESCSERQEHGRHTVEDGLLFVLIAELLARLIQRWQASRRQTR